MFDLYILFLINEKGTNLHILISPYDELAHYVLYCSHFLSYGSFSSWKCKNSTIQNYSMFHYLLQYLKEPF